MEQAQPIAELLPNALTAVSAPPTKAKPVCTKDWADWLGVQTHQDPQLEQLVEACGLFGQAFKYREQPRWLSILGASGTGKTHCARKLWNRLARGFDWSKRKFVHCEVYWPKFVSELRGGEAYERFNDMADWPVLFLDDIGAERDTTGFSSEQLNLLLGARMDKWTLVTSNLFLEQVGGIEPRIADRMIRQPNICVEVNTKSYALRTMKK